MTGLGTIIDCVAVVCGGLFGMLFGSKLTKRFQDILLSAMGLAVIFIGASGALNYLIDIHQKDGETQKIVLMVLSLALGCAVGEAINISKRTEQFGTWLRKKVHSEKDAKFVDAFVNGSLTVCIGAMAVIGPIQDALQHNLATLIMKSILDFVIIMVMACAMGKGVIFSVIPMGIFQGLITLLSKVIEPILTDGAVESVSFLGSMLIFCVGINIMFDKKINVANMLMSLIFIVAFSYIPII